MDHIYGRPKAEVGFICWRVCFSHQAPCWRTCSLILMAGIFSTPERRTVRRGGPTSLLMRAAEAGQKKEKEKKNRRKSGYIHMKWNVGRVIAREKWKVDAFLVPKQHWRRFSIPFNRQCSPVIELDITAGQLGGWALIWCMPWSVL